MQHKRQFQRHAAEQARRAGLVAPAPAVVADASPDPAPVRVDPLALADLVLLAPVAESTTGVDTGVDTTVAPEPAPAPNADPAPVLSDAPGPISLTFTSSNIRTADLDESLGIVTVLFQSGKAYRYGNFSRADMATWSAARSAGSWFNANVKNRSDLHPMIPDVAPAPAGA